MMDLEMLSENEDDIGALGSILSWDDDDDDDDGDDAVDRSAAALNAALRERESSGGASAPPDMVQFSMKDGVPQFNFLSNTSTASVSQMTTSGNSSSFTLQLPMPTPFSKLEQESSFLTNGFTHQPHQIAADSRGDHHQQKQQQHAEEQKSNANNSQTQTHNYMQQLLPQQQTQQSLAASFAQLLAQQADAIFQQQRQHTAQPNASQEQHDGSVPNQMQLQQFQQQRQVVQQVQFQQQQREEQAAQQQATQQAQQMQQQLLQAHHEKLRQAQQQPVHHVQQQQSQPIHPQPAQGNQQQMFSFGGDAAALLQQLTFAQFQQQLQQLAQQQQQSSPSPAPVPNVPMPAQLHATPALNPRPPPTREIPPPAKKARKSKAQSQKASSSKSPSKKPVTASAASPAAVLTKAGVVSSDTDCDGPNKTEIISTGSGDGPLQPLQPALPAKKAPAVAAAAAPEDSKNNQDAGNLSADDKAQANRDRNREHARNTRLRKKAYLEKLKGTVEVLCRERDTLVSERAGAANLLVEMNNTRTEVLMSFFALRSSNEKRRKLWSSILDESSFTCVMPVTPYRSFPASEVQVSKCQRTIMGIDAMMADTASLHVLFQSFVDRTKFPDARIEFRYTLVTEESVVAGNQMMARWVMSTVNATNCGALTEVAKQGMLCCKFNSAHRIIGLELMFDVMAFMLQLKQASGSDSFSVIPNTVQTCQRSFDRPMVMTLAEPPFTIVQVNRLWEEMTGYTANEVVGKASCAILQGPNTDRTSLEQMMEEIRFKRSASLYVRNVKKSGEEFNHFILAFPLSTDSRVTHYVSLSNHVELCASERTHKTLAQRAVVVPAMKPLPNPSAQAPHHNANGQAPQQISQFFVAPPSMASPAMMFTQPQTVGSNNFQMGPPGLMAPPAPPAHTKIRPPS